MLKNQLKICLKFFIVFFALFLHFWAEFVWSIFKDQMLEYCFYFCHLLVQNVHRLSCNFHSKKSSHFLLAKSLLEILSKQCKIPLESLSIWYKFCLFLFKAQLRSPKWFVGDFVHFFKQCFLVWFFDPKFKFLINSCSYFVISKESNCFSKIFQEFLIRKLAHLKALVLSSKEKYYCLKLLTHFC